MLTIDLMHPKIKTKFLILKFDTFERFFILTEFGKLGKFA